MRKHQAPSQKILNQIHMNKRELWLGTIVLLRFPVFLSVAACLPFCNQEVTYFRTGHTVSGGPLIWIISSALTVWISRLLRTEVCCIFMALKPRSHSAEAIGNSSTICFRLFNVFPTRFTFTLCSRKSASALATSNPNNFASFANSLSPYSILSVSSSGQTEGHNTFASDKRPPSQNRLLRLSDNDW